MHLKSLFIALSLLASDAAASTSYGCWNHKNYKFHQDCIVAYTALITQQSGSDNRAWIPNFYVNMYWGSCYARITSRGGSGGGQVVSSLNLLASYDQLGSRCQDGYFFYDDGWINAELHGVGGWKRDEIPEEVLANRTEAPEKPVDVFEPPTDAKVTWEIDEGVTPLNKRTTAWTPRGRKLTKRATGTYLGSWNVPGRSGSYSLFRDGTTNIGNKPGSSILVNNMRGTASIMINEARYKTTKELIKAGAETTSGSSVVVAGLSMVLEAGDPSWSAIIGNLGDNGNLFENAFSLAINDWSSQPNNVGIYYLYNAGDWRLVRFVINGITGLLSDLPSS